MSHWFRSFPDVSRPAAMRLATRFAVAGALAAALTSTQAAPFPPAPTGASPAQQTAPKRDPFAPTRWVVRPRAAPLPPPPPPVPEPPPEPPPAEPVAPPMPFTVIGGLDDGERKRVFLVRSDRVYAAAEGEVLDNTYHVERIDSTHIILIYLPLNLRQSVSLGKTP
jgi:hypothetical protein